MRKLFFQMAISLDGFFEGTDHDISWHNVDAEFNEYAIAMLHSVDAIIFGRVTYELMANYWPTEAAKGDDPIVAGLMNRLPKYVVSKTLQQVAWENSTLLTGDVIEQVSKLKQQSGKAIVLGSSDLAVLLSQHNLIDEYDIIVCPVVLGSGKTVFSGMKQQLRLKLIDVKIFRTGNVLLKYQPENNLPM